VHEAERQGVLPPVKLLAGEFRKPTLAELPEVLALHHLSRCLEAKYNSIRHNDLPHHSYYDAWRHATSTEPASPAGDCTPDEAEDNHLWRERFDTAVYTSLLLGAVLTRAYFLPFLNETASPAKLSLLGRFTNDPFVGFNGPYLSQPEVKYLVRSFAAYDFLGTFTHQDLAFDSTADWFVHATLKDLEGTDPPSSALSYLAFQNKERKLFHISPRSRIWPWDKALSSHYTRGPPSEGDALSAAIMRAYEMVTFLLRCAVAALDVPTWPRPSIRSENYTPPLSMRTAKVVLFGIFQAETIQMPAVISDIPSCPLVAFKIAPSNTVSDIAGVLGWLHIALVEDSTGSYYPLHQYDADNVHSGPTMPSPPIQFFAFMLKKYFKVRLEWVGTGNERWRHF
jgi:hypothetical protein